MTRPNPSDLRHWRQDNITRWVMSRVEEKFKPLPASQLAKDWSDHNLRVGQQQVIELINKLCDEIPNPQS